MQGASGQVALLGTGVAPLVAATRLLEEGRSVLVLNPDWDFFREDSELAFDPLLPGIGGSLEIERLERSLTDRVIAELRPVFPGAIELWPAAQGGFRDPSAPHVRSRARAWLRSSVRRAGSLDWEAVEDMYIASSDAGLKPQIIEGLAALRKFPGVGGRPGVSEGLRSVILNRLADVDVSRYRYGLLEFVRERLGPERMVTGASQVELFPEGVRFHAGGAPRTARISALVVFWTPRLTQWVLSRAREAEVQPWEPRGVRLWEEWSLLSRDSLDPGVIGCFEDMVMWAEAEGAPPESGNHRLAVLKAGPLVPVDSLERPWVSPESFTSLYGLCHDLMQWERFTVRAVRTRAILEWTRPGQFSLQDGPVRARVICGCDGPLPEVAWVARQACERLS